MSECESHYLSRRGELNLLLNLPIDFRTEPIVDEGSLERLTINGLSYAGLQEMLSVRSDQKMAHSNIIASQADLKLQKSLAFPEFSVKGNYDRQGNLLIIISLSGLVCLFLSLTVTKGISRWHASIS